MIKIFITNLFPTTWRSPERQKLTWRSQKLLRSHDRKTTALPKRKKRAMSFYST